jgi:hypothetical protein
MRTNLYLVTESILTIQELPPRGICTDNSLLPLHLGSAMLAFSLNTPSGNSFGLSGELEPLSPPLKKHFTVKNEINIDDGGDGDPEEDDDSDSDDEDGFDGNEDAGGDGSRDDSDDKDKFDEDDEDEDLVGNGNGTEEEADLEHDEELDEDEYDDDLDDHEADEEFEEEDDEEEYGTDWDEDDEDGFGDNDDKLKPISTSPQHEELSFSPSPSHKTRLALPSTTTPNVVVLGQEYIEFEIT